jgi:transposase-like protein
MRDQKEEEQSITCKYCGSNAVVKYGKYRGKQLYWCKVCKRKFKGDDALFHMKIKPEYVSRALSEYYTGMSIADIANTLGQETGYKPSKHTVYNWLVKFTDIAVNHFRDYKPNVGDIWIADETVLDMDKQKMWLWDIIDTETRYLLATRLSRSRTTQDAQMLINRAVKTAGKYPKAVVTDKLASYLDVFYGKDAEHRQGSPFSKEDSTSLIERFHGTLKDRTKVMRGFKDFETLHQFVEGFLAFYNFIRPHEALNGRTPAEVAGIDYDVRTWADVCRVPIAEQVEAVSLRKTRPPKSRVKLPRVQIGRPRKRHRKPKKPADTQPSISTIRSIK